MKWLDQSIMHMRGGARGQVGNTHELTEVRQGKFHYTIDPKYSVGAAIDKQYLAPTA